MQQAPVLQQQPRRGGGAGKFIVGCIVVVFILGILLFAAAWWFFARPAMQALQSVEQVANLPRIETQLSNRASFTPPASGELTEPQVERYVAVLETVYTGLEGNVAQLEQRYAQFGQEQPTLMDLLRLAGAYRDYIGLIVSARETQIAAMNQQGFSAGEYEWIRQQTLRAANISTFTITSDDFAAALTGGGSTSRSADTGPVPEANVELVAPYRERLNRVAGLTAFGL